MNFMKWQGMKPTIIEISDGDGDKTSNKDKVTSPSPKVLPTHAFALSATCLLQPLPTDLTNEPIQEAAVPQPHEGSLA